MLGYYYSRALGHALKWPLAGLLSYYLYKAGDFNYRVRHPLVVARYHRNRWIKTDKWNLGRQRRV